LDRVGFPVLRSYYAPGGQAVRNTEVSRRHRVSRIVNSDLSLDEMPGQIVMLTAQVCACDACIIYLLESTNGEFVLRASQVPHERIGSLRMQLGEGVTGWAAQHGSPVALSSRAFERQREQLEAEVAHRTAELQALKSSMTCWTSPKLDARKVALNWVEFNLEQALQDTTEALSFLAGQKGLELRSEIEPGVPWALVGDPSRAGITRPQGI